MGHRFTVHSALCLALVGCYADPPEVELHVVRPSSCFNVVIRVCPYGTGCSCLKSGNGNRAGIL